MVWDADTDGIEMVVIEMAEVGIFGEDDGEFAGDILVDE